jgi:ABC-2 type transport system permease protein
VSGRDAAILVARREFGERARQRSFQISFGVTVAIVVVVAVLSGVLGSDDTERYEVGAQGAQAVAIAEAAHELGPRFDVRVQPRRFADVAQARAAVRDEEVEVAIVGGSLIAREDPPDDLALVVQAAAREVRAGELLRAQGVEPDEARRALNPPPLAVHTLEDDSNDERSGVAFTASLILYLQLIVFGLAVATAVVEDKASRVVEVLLATIPSRSLLAGKIVGIGLLGLLQLLAIAVAGLGAAAASGAIELSGSDAGALAVALLWFLFGYALWATLYAIAGVIVSRQEDLQSASTVLTTVLAVSYLVVFPVLEDPSSTLAVVASLVPLCSPIVMPARVVLGEVGALEIAASLGLLAASVAVLLVLGARIYDRAILRMGRPLKLTEAWRLARG